MKYVLYLFLVLVCIILAGCDSSKNCYDEGISQGEVLLNVNGGSDQESIITNSDESQLYKWVDSGYVVSGPLKMKLNDTWLPWGYKGVNWECTMESCDDSNVQLCKRTDLPGGKVIARDHRYGNCYLKEGLGIYGMIADPSVDVDKDPYDQSGIHSNPHASQDWESVRTFHLNDFYDKGSNMIVINELPYFSFENDFYIMGDTEPLSGKLYFKVLDSYYGDNEVGSMNGQSEREIKISLLDGIQQSGLVTELFGVINDTLMRVSNKAQRNIFSDSGYRRTVALIFVLYVLIFALSLMLGLVRTQISDIMTHLFKMVTIVMILAHYDSALVFFNVYLIGLFRSFGETFSNIMIGASGMNDTSLHGFGFLVIYDDMLDYFISKELHLKIWSLLFVWPPRFYFIPLLYTLVCVVIQNILRCLSYYLLAIMQVALLSAILPIFIVMILFKVTGDYFQRWLQFMGSSAMLVITTTAAARLMYYVTKDLFYTLFNYSICNKNIALHLIYWYQPVGDAYRDAITLSHYGVALFTSLLFGLFISNLPGLSDALAASSAAPSRSSANAMSGGFSQAMGFAERRFRDTAGIRGKMKRDHVVEFNSVTGTYGARAKTSTEMSTERLTKRMQKDMDSATRSLNKGLLKDRSERRKLDVRDKKIDEHYDKKIAKKEQAIKNITALRQQLKSGTLDDALASKAYKDLTKANKLGNTWSKIAYRAPYKLKDGMKKMKDSRFANKLKVKSFDKYSDKRAVRYFQKFLDYSILKPGQYLFRKTKDGKLDKDGTRGITKISNIIRKIDVAEIMRKSMKKYDDSMHYKSLGVEDFIDKGKDKGKNNDKDNKEDEKKEKDEKSDRDGIDATIGSTDDVDAEMGIKSEEEKFKKQQEETEELREEMRESREFLEEVSEILERDEDPEGDNSGS